MATAYIVAATPSSPEPKRISNLKSAKTEADARAKLDRVDVEVRTEATSKLTYTAQGAPVATAPEPAAPAADDETTLSAAAVTETLASEQAGRDAEDAAVAEANAVAERAADDEDGESGEEFDALLNAVIDEATATVAQAAAITAALENAPDQEDENSDEDAAPAADAHRGQAACGCSVEKIVETGEHGKGCADAPKAAEAAKAVERDKPARAPRTGTGGGTRREAQGDAAVEGWELLYDKPKQKAQVGRKDGKYALICTTHKHAHPLTRLVQERGLRGGRRSVWCPSCTDK